MNAALHHCHAIGCSTQCKPELLMCFPCWKKVPLIAQQLVHATYRKGQCDDKNPSAEWLVAATCAVMYVALRTGTINKRDFLNGLRSWVMAIAAHFEEE
jgi:hypothetical protein